MCFVWIWEQTAVISLYSIDWLVCITETQCVYCAVRSTLYVLPTQCVYVFCVDLRTNSDYITVKHWLADFYLWDGLFIARYVLHCTFCPQSEFMCFVWIWEQTAIILLYSIDWLVSITKTESVYCAVRSTFTFCPHSVFVCFVWVWEQTAIISLYKFDLLVLITETGSFNLHVCTSIYIQIYNSCQFGYTKC
jgi:hypothetical protein